eukprot:GHRR01017423.1.p1 GENE.GHRR01017423.1~~GHRR01017423.1.p1  ORF type:complete len:117 (-),score=18.23 GHRR01017423.1:944-1294(-)
MRAGQMQACNKGATSGMETCWLACAADTVTWQTWQCADSCSVSLQAFQARTSRAPEQCVRYCFQPGALPLWPSHLHQPQPSDIPPCPHCGRHRQFEFQVSGKLSTLLAGDLCLCHS